MYDNDRRTTRCWKTPGLETPSCMFGCRSVPQAREQKPEIRLRARRLTAKITKPPAPAALVRSSRLGFGIRGNQAAREAAPKKRSTGTEAQWPSTGDRFLYTGSPFVKRMPRLIPRPSLVIPFDAPWCGRRLATGCISVTDLTVFGTHGARGRKPIIRTGRVRHTFGGKHPERME